MLAQLKIESNNFCILGLFTKCSSQVHLPVKIFVGKLQISVILKSLLPISAICIVSFLQINAYLYELPNMPSTNYSISPKIQLQAIRLIH